MTRHFNKNPIISCVFLRVLRRVRCRGVPLTRLVRLRRSAVWESASLIRSTTARRSGASRGQSRSTGARSTNLVADSTVSRRSVRNGSTPLTTRANSADSARGRSTLSPTTVDGKELSVPLTTSAARSPDRTRYLSTSLALPVRSEVSGKSLSSKATTVHDGESAPMRWIPSITNPTTSTRNR